MLKKILPLFFVILSIISCGTCSLEVEYYSCGLVPEIDKVNDADRNANRLYIYNISGEKINSVKIIYGEASFDEAEKYAEPSWDKYDNLLESPIRDGEDFCCKLDVAEDLKTLWVRIDTSDRHCVFAVVYEAGSRIDVNIRKSDN